MSDTRQQRIEQIVTQFITDFPQTFDDDTALKTIQAVCSPNITWSDHAFHIQRTGHTTVLGLRKTFTHCNQPFETRLKRLHHTDTGAIVEAIWIGNCKNDIVRPDGEVAVKANGKDFVCHVCFVMDIDLTHGITKIDEYYSKAWWDGISEERYKKLSGASMQTSPGSGS